MLAAAVLLLAALPLRAEPLRVCADPNNLPFSNAQGDGFENEIARLLAAELGRDGVAYTWWPQRRGFIRHTLRAGRCDVVLGVPAGYELARTTRPYYRSTYVFVTRRDGPRVASLDDPALRRLRIGVHVVGDDGANVPPAQALALRGITRLRGYSIYGDYSKPNPPRELIDAVARGEIDVAVAWGPLAGYFAPRAEAPLELVPVTPADDRLAPMTFAIAMGVRRNDGELLRALEGALERRRDDIRRILRRYGMPMP